DWLGLPLLLLRDDGLSQQWQWYFSEQMRVDTLSVSETDSWPDRDWLLQQVACHYQQQATINWHRLQQWFGAPAAGTAAQLPLYPYQRKNFWLDPLPVTPVVANTTSTQLVSFGRPALMNEVQRLAGFPDLCWYRLLFDRQQQFLAQHLIFNTPISPAAAHVAMLLTALQQLGQAGWAIRQLELHQPLVLPAGTSQRAVQLTLKGELLNGAGSQAMAELRSAADAHSAATDWSLHARAEFSAVPDSLYRQQQRRLQQMFQAPPQDEGEIAAPWYQHLATLGYQLGDGYRRIKQIWRPEPYRAWCRVEQAEDQDLAGAVVAPGLIDSLLQSLICSVPDLIDQMQQGGWIYIPFSVGEIIPFASLDQPYYWCYSESKVQGPLLTGRVLVFGADGELKMLVDDFSVKQTDQRALLGRALAGSVAAEAANDPAAISWQKTWQAELVAPPHATSKEAAQFCLLTAPGATVPPQWQALIAQSQHPKAKRLLLLLSTQPVNRALSEQLAEQAEWLRQQIPQWLMHEQQQLQLVLLDNQPDSPYSSALQAFQQVLRLEYPGQIADLLLLPTDVPANVLAEALQATPSALQGQIRRWQGRGPGQGKEQGQGQGQGQWQLPQLVATPLPAPATSQPFDGTVLLTGGQSALATVVLPQLLAQGAAAVVICSRRAEPADFAAWLSSVLPDATQAPRVHWSCTDVCDAAALALCLQQIEDTLPPLQGIWHCAGQLADVSLARMSAGQLSAVLAPKVRASLNLHQATLHLPLRQFVLFSSVAGVLGNFGQANYALGNGFMDGLAQLRQSQGLAGLSISWGPWQQGGMALQQAGKISAQGYQWLTPELLQPLWPALCAASGHWLLAQADWPMLASRLQHPGLLNQLISQSNISTQSSEPATGLAPISSWQQLPRPEAQVAVEHWLSELVEESSGIAPDLTQSLMEQGIDSLGAVTIRSQLSQQLALSLPVSLLFNFPSVQALSGELCSRLFGPELVASSAEIPQDTQFNYLEDLSEAELNALILQEFSAV
ncbi:MAG: SDR family NAD(P)-dependent oxidoreductase, partial [Gammaproteobacteria bacterium]|nr:SDR family NAD(P)-dependent oxidoreductase [Gammaproteobacteria bacterium]